VAHVLVIDDDAAIRSALSALLRHRSHQVTFANDGEEGVSTYAQHRPDLVIMDLTMPRLNGVEALARIRQHDPTAVAIFVTAFGTVRSAVEAMKVGGFDFLTKPFDNDELILAVERALAFKHLTSKVARLEADLDGRSSFPGIVGRSPVLLESLRMLSRVARVDATVLLLGESGTGKGLAASSLHRQSPRASGPFVALNCGAIPQTLAESELFGHERGAFTDAKETRAGRFEQAHGGTIFLDEVGELPLDLQTKLLRVLEDKVIWRVGGRQALPIDVRVIAATNRDLKDAITRGAFREDLFWRLNVFTITLPPLRERREDLALLIDHLIERLNARLALQCRGVSRQASQKLEAHDWPGNIRELENVLQRAMILGDGPMIEGHNISLEGPPGAPSAENVADDAIAGNLEDIVRRATDRIERTLIETTLSQFKGNRGRAAAALGIGRRTLFRKMKRWELVATDAADTDEPD
jgi:DNA-binding NtrC family response regulator